MTRQAWIDTNIRGEQMTWAQRTILDYTQLGMLAQSKLADFNPSRPRGTQMKNERW